LTFIGMLAQHVPVLNFKNSADAVWHGGSHLFARGGANASELDRVAEKLLGCFLLYLHR